MRVDDHGVWFQNSTSNANALLNTASAAGIGPCRVEHGAVLLDQPVIAVVPVELEPVPVDAARRERQRPAQQSVAPDARQRGGEAEPEVVGRREQEVDVGRAHVGRGDVVEPAAERRPQLSVVAELDIGQVPRHLDEVDDVLLGGVGGELGVQPDVARDVQEVLLQVVAEDVRIGVAPPDRGDERQLLPRLDVRRAERPQPDRQGRHRAASRVLLRLGVEAGHQASLELDELR